MAPPLLEVPQLETINTRSDEKLTGERFAMRFESYEVGEFFDEMFGESGQPRASARSLVNNIEKLPEGELLNRQRATESALLHMGITFNVYGEHAGVEKIFPFDLLPRIIPAK